MSSAHTVAHRSVVPIEVSMRRPDNESPTIKPAASNPLGAHSSGDSDREHTPQQQRQQQSRHSEVADTVNAREIVCDRGRHDETVKNTQPGSARESQRYPLHMEQCVSSWARLVTPS